MDSHRFDALTRRLGVGSRRQVLSALAAGLLAAVVRGPDAEDLQAAACKGFNAKCKGNGSCCAADGLRCVKVGKSKKGKKAKKRCRCKNGTCPDQTPCCVGGKCEDLCGDGMGGDTCCADCFVEVDGAGIPIPSTAECCPADKICGPNPKKLSDDRCCSDVEECVEGACCLNNGFLGSIVCGGKCCAQDACCNGQCCGDNQVCVTTQTGDQCLSANRTCEIGEPDCFSEESCVGGVCCSDLRTCTNQMGHDICCPAGTFCQEPGSSQACCPINTTCNSFKGHRVRR